MDIKQRAYNWRYKFIGVCLGTLLLAGCSNPIDRQALLLMPHEAAPSQAEISNHSLTSEEQPLATQSPATLQTADAGMVVTTTLTATADSVNDTSVAASRPTPTVVAMRTLEPLVPTVVAVPEPAAVATLPADMNATANENEGVAAMPPHARRRVGVGVPLYVAQFEFDANLAQQLGMGWYLDWNTDATPVRAEGLKYAQLYSMRGGNIPLQQDKIAEAAAANPGALWLAGNEPDVVWQDNQTPDRYAALYHEFYTAVKAADPTAQVAIAGVSQVTPLRLQYLEAVMAAYEQAYGEPLPVDVWNVHTFILREERGSWGVGIPPGFDAVDQGMLWEITDHDNLELFRQQVVDFRRWMAKHDQRDKPLIVTEFGILMPAEYGFPPERVAAFMTATFDYLLTATDDEIGFSADANRLVQRLLWYSLSDSVYPTGNLADLQTGQLTSLGQVFAAYTAKLQD